MESSAAVTLLYTAALGGQLDLLPRLFTRIRAERAATSSQVLLVDLGRSCLPDTWFCQATDGRGMLVAMDAMGYDAFHLGPLDMLYTQPERVDQLRSVILTPLAAGPWTASVRRNHSNLIVKIVNAAALPKLLSDDILSSEERSDLLIGLRLSAAARCEAVWQSGRRVVAIDPGWIEPTPLLGRLDMVLLAGPPYIRVEDHRHLGLVPDLLDQWPDPTITGVVDFVRSEARYAEQKRGQR